MRSVINIKQLLYSLQPLSIVEKVIFDYRVHGMTVFMQRAHKRVKGLADKETWKIKEYTDYGAITELVSC